MWNDPEELLTEFKSKKYFLDQSVALVLYLACEMGKPLLVEGPAGVGKTELAKILAEVRGAKLLRLQCYEGLDEGKALYEWNYQMQLLYIEAAKQKAEWSQLRKDVYTEEFLLSRPLLAALRTTRPAVLLIDELDKSDEEFESFLLEFLAEFQMTIPELGTIRAKNKPVVIITSNNTRDFSEALKRRCFHLYLDYPDFAREMEIISSKVPELPALLARQVVTFVQNLRQHDLKKIPSIAETIDWAKALLIMGKESLDLDTVKSSLSTLLKFQEDIRKIEPKLEYMLSTSHLK